MANNPYISVIVTAYNRKKYLLGAARSALNQTLPKDLYEVIVVKNFRDEAIDRKLEEWGVENLYSENVGIGPKVVDALTFARGNVVAFLEDDDEFLPEKLEKVLRIFSSRPEVGFYRNGLLVVDEHGKPIGRYRVRETVEADCSEWGPMRYMAAHGLLFNSSSVAIRRDILEDGSDILRKLDLTVDSYYPLRTLMSGYRALMDPSLLTAYRIHWGSATRYLGTFKSFRLHDVGISLRHFKDAKLILEAAKGSRCEPLARYVYALHAIGLMRAAGGLRIERELRGSLDLSLRDILKCSGVELLSLEPLELAGLAWCLVSLVLPGAIKSSIAYLVYVWNLRRRYNLVE